MKTILKFTVFTAVLLILTGGLGSCKKEEPKEILFTRYCLNDPCRWSNLFGHCQWTNFSDYKVIVINNREKLENHVSCTDFPDINFSTHTLLLAGGAAPSLVENIRVDFYKNSKNKYTMILAFDLTGLTMIDRWVVAILVPKIVDKSIVDLDLDIW